MRLERIKVHNFKSIPPAGVTVRFRDRIAVLVGRNNAGKSTILEAIGLVAGTKNPRYQRYDPAWFHDLAQPITVEIELSGVDWEEGKRIGLSDHQCSQFARSRKTRIDPHAGKIVLQLTAHAADEEAAPTEEPDSEAEPEKKTQFVILLGGGFEVRKTEGIRKSLLRSIFVPALRVHSDLLAPSVWTSYGRLLRDLLSESKQLDDLRTLISTTTTRLQSILAEEAASITEAARGTAYVDKVDFRLTKEGDPLELLRNVTLAVTYAGRTDDLDAVGTGTQSAVVLGVLELCLRHRPAVGIRLFVVEEPELYLHPHAQRYMARLLRAIAEENTYVLVTTHSSDVVNGMDIRDVVRVARAGGGETNVHQLAANIELASFERLLTRESADMLFADRVVLVEGASETALLPGISPLVGPSCDFDRRNMSVVNVEGKGGFARVTGFLDGLSIPWRIVADRDALAGKDLQPFRDPAGMTSGTDELEAIRKLRKQGVCVLKFGEIEDYYPLEALAAIAACPLPDVAAKIEEARVAADTPSSSKVLQAVLLEHRDEVAAAAPERVPKLAAAWHSQAVARLRDQGEPTLLKTGEAISKWLRMPKPLIAMKLAAWLRENEAALPPRLKLLISWLAGGDDVLGQTHDQ